MFFRSIINNLLRNCDAYALNTSNIAQLKVDLKQKPSNQEIKNTFSLCADVKGNTKDN